MMNTEHVLFYQPVQGFHPGFATHSLTMGKVLTPNFGRSLGGKMWVSIYNHGKS